MIHEVEHRGQIVDKESIDDDHSCNTISLMIGWEWEGYSPFVKNMAT